MVLLQLQRYQNQRLKSEDSAIQLVILKRPGRTWHEKTKVKKCIKHGSCSKSKSNLHFLKLSCLFCWCFPHGKKTSTLALCFLASTYPSHKSALDSTIFNPSTPICFHRLNGFAQTLLNLCSICSISSSAHQKMHSCAIICWIWCRSLGLKTCMVSNPL